MQPSAEELRSAWYIPPKPVPPNDWLVFSQEAMLRVLQGKREDPGPVNRSAAWVFAVSLVRAVLALAQALIMLLASIPVVHGLLEPTITHWRRGSLGFFLRAAYWKARLRRLGTDTLIDRGVEIWGAANIEIGAGCHLDTNVRLAAGEAGHAQHGRLVVGNFTHLGPRCHVAARGGVTIGDLVSLQAGVHVYSASNQILDLARPGMLISFSHMAPPEMQHTTEGPVVIEDYASVGFASILLPSVTLGEGCVVHPYAQVTQSFPAFANVTGPGRARQNGWRRPLRPDPRRTTAGSEGSDPRE